MEETLWWNNWPIPGMSPKSGILLSVLDLLFFIKPPMTTVWPSGVTTTVLADSMAMAGAVMGGTPLVACR
jgi:hypothetical protein